MTHWTSSFFFKLLPIVTSLAWIHPLASSGTVRTHKPLALTLREDEDTMRRDIQQMKELALQKIKDLEQKMEEMKHEEDPPSLVAVNKHDKVMENQSSTPEIQVATPSPSATTPALDRSRNDLQLQNLPNGNNNMDLLDNTRWKIAFNIGREPGTWMPKTWGISQERLRLEIVADLTNEPYYEREEFFQSVAGAKVLRIHDAFCFPTAVGVGRKSIRVKPTGAYKVVPGQGPMQTDVLRFFVELEEPVVKNDVECPAGRVYGTCGYFPMPTALPGGKAGPVERHQYKDYLAKEYHARILELESLQAEADTDTRLFSIDQVKRMKKIMDIKADMERIQAKQKEANFRQPDKSTLRLSRNGDVGLSKEGGVCIKVHKGLSIEYHILGRMEVASVAMREDHDEYEDLVHELHP